MNRNPSLQSNCELSPPMLELIEILARIAYENLRRKRTETATEPSTGNVQAA